MFRCHMATTPVLWTFAGNARVAPSLTWPPGERLNGTLDWLSVRASYAAAMVSRPDSIDALRSPCGPLCRLTCRGATIHEIAARAVGEARPRPIEHALDPGSRAPRC